MRVSLTVALLWLALTIPPAFVRAEPVHLRGSFVVIDRPEGFVESPTVPGLIWEKAKASVLTTELPASSFDALRQAILDGRGKLGTQQDGEEIELSSADQAEIDGYPAVIGEGRQRVGVGTMEKWIVLIGTPEAALLITAQMPSLFAAPERRAQIEKVMDSIRVAAERSNPLDALPFEFQETERFRLTQVLSAYAVILTDSHLVSEPEQRGLFVIGTGAKADCSLWAQSGKQAFAESLVRRLKSVQALEALETTPAQFDGNEGYRTETHGQVNGQRALIMQTVRFDGCRFARTIGIGPARLEELYRQEFATLARGMVWKPAETERSAKPEKPAAKAGNASPTTTQ